MKEAIFKNDELQQQFEKEGFIKMKLFSESTIDTLAERCRSYFPEDCNRFFSSSYLNDFSKKKEISDAIIELIYPFLEKHFINFRSIGAAFLIKGTGEQSEMPMHQDWTIVDEEKYFALNVWIPLTATNEKNGTLEVMKGSHKWMAAKRAPTLPFPYQGHQDKIKPHLTAVNTEPGEVVVLNQALIHYSKPNLTSELRPAITAGVISKEAPLSLYYWNREKPTELEIFEQEDDFLLRFENFHETIFKRPSIGKSSGSIAYEIHEIEEERLQEWLSPKPMQKQKKNLFQRIFYPHA